MACSVGSSSGATSVMAVPGRLGAARPARRGARTMSALCGHVVVDDVRDAVDVEAAGRDVGRDERRVAARPEPLDGGRPVLLRPVGVQRRAADAARRQARRQLVRAALRADEHERRARAVRRRNRVSHSTFSRAGITCAMCEMVVAGPARPADLDEPRIAHHLLGQRHHVRRGRGREEQRLARRRAAPTRSCCTSGQNPMSSMRSASSRTSTSTLLKSTMPRAHVVEQAARRGHDDVGAGAQGPDLDVAVHAAVDRHAGQRRVVREAGEVVLDLDRQLARRREHEHPDRAGRRRGRAAAA